MASPWANSGSHESAGNIEDSLEIPSWSLGAVGSQGVDGWWTSEGRGDFFSQDSPQPLSSGGNMSPAIAGSIDEQLGLPGRLPVESFAVIEQYHPPLLQRHHVSRSPSYSTDRSSPDKHLHGPSLASSSPRTSVDSSPAAESFGSQTDDSPPASESTVRAVATDSSSPHKPPCRKTFQMIVHCTHSCLDSGRPKVFKSRDVLARHERECHYRHTMKQFACRFALSGSVPSLECYFCDQEFSDVDAVHSHIRQCHNIDACENSAHTFVREDDFGRHITKKHIHDRTAKGELPPGKNWKLLFELQPQPIGFGCKLCIKPLTTWDHRIDHYLSHVENCNAGFAIPSSTNEILGLLHLPLYRGHWQSSTKGLAKSCTWPESPEARVLIRDLEMGICDPRELVYRALSLGAYSQEGMSVRGVCRSRANRLR